jgi:hypothetical protein
MADHRRRTVDVEVPRYGKGVPLILLLFFWGGEMLRTEEGKLIIKARAAEDRAAPSDGQKRDVMKVS